MSKVNIISAGLGRTMHLVWVSGFAAAAMTKWQPYQQIGRSTSTWYFQGRVWLAGAGCLFFPLGM